MIGALKDNGSLDKNFLVNISQMCSGIDLTFHRAFDELCEWKKSLDEIISIGFTRILTSGRSTKIESCFKNLKEIINYAEERIEIMIGGGINSKNVKEIIKQLEIRSIHFSGTVLKSIDEQSLFNCDSLVVDEKVVKSIIDSIDSVI